MLVSLGRSATGPLASTSLATPFARLVVSRAATKLRFRAPGIYRPSQAIRGFAAAARPKKATTSKSAATAKKSVKTSTTKKTTAKAKPKAKAQAKSKSKPKSKPKSKSKAKAKAKAKPKSKRPKKISPERKAMLDRRSLRETALLAEPKLRPEQAYRLYIAESTQGKSGQSVISQMTVLGRDYKALPAAEVERLKSVAGQNKSANAVDYKAWVESHTAQEIFDANRARKSLKRKYNIPKGAVKLIRDDRLPKKPTTAFALYTKARWGSGEYSGVDVVGVARKIGVEWNALAPAQRKPYEDLANSQLERYEKEMDAVVVRPKSRSTKSPSP
ncbi:hypothetical protein F4859DRAFT_361691 [Xylaria cf. heliscus]|nr:hypothetical protein F4859DRAFT_361691 [Xylaria cf. heliscus]